MDSSAIEEEIEALKHIYLEDAVHTTSSELQVRLRPSCDPLSSLIEILVQIKGPETHISFPYVSGVSDTTIQTLQSQLSAENWHSFSDIIEYVKLFLDDLTKVDETCMICLCAFTSNCQIHKTECAHFFHSLCINRLKSATPKDQSSLCPVCNAVLDLSDLPASMTLHSPSVDKTQGKPFQKFQWTPKLKKLYEKQKTNNGFFCGFEQMVTLEDLDRVHAEELKRIAAEAEKLAKEEAKKDEVKPGTSSRDKHHKPRNRHFRKKQPNTSKSETKS